MADRSWVTSKGKYYAPSNQFYKTTDESIEEGYIDTVNNLVNSRLNISRMIIENDYYKYITR